MDDDTQPIGTSVLRRDARFLDLPRPDYDVDHGGIRPGAAPTLSLIGGTLLFAAAFGSWLRVTRLAAPNGEPELVQEVLGRDLTGGALLAILGIAAVVATAGWFRDSRRVRRAAHIAVLSGAVVASALLLSLQARIGDAAAAAIDQAGFFDLNLGAGWGAWSALVAAAALVLSSVFAALAGPPVTAVDPDPGGPR